MSDRGTAELGSSRSGTDLELEHQPAEPRSKKGKGKGKKSESEGKGRPGGGVGGDGGGSDVENVEKGRGEKTYGKDGNKNEDGKKSGGVDKKENGKKGNKKDEDKEDEGKRDSVMTSYRVLDKATEEQNKKLNDDLMKVWMEYQATTRESSMKIQRLESTLKTLESSLDRFGKFCGEYQLIWRVKNFSQRFDEARSGQKPIIYSPTFDTHRSGYKLQLSLCPNGDGKGHGVSLSLFFAILKGPYDSLLRWPFICPVTMTLLEQVPDQTVREPRDVTMTFVPNPRPDNLPFLGKPDDAKNLSLGFQKFVLLTDLFEGEYIEDDSIFIKVYVDISNVMAL